MAKNRAPAWMAGLEIAYWKEICAVPLNGGQPHNSLPAAGTAVALSPFPRAVLCSAPSGKEVQGLLPCLPSGPLSHCNFSLRMEEEKTLWLPLKEFSC